MRLRPLLIALLGLMFWVQGMAIAAAPVDMPADPAESTMEMPCHGDAVDVAPCDCCDGDCPDMASCVIGQVFAAPPATTAPLAAATQPAVAAGGWSLQTAILPLPLRPPIVLHA